MIQGKEIHRGIKKEKTLTKNWGFWLSKKKQKKKNRNNFVETTFPLKSAGIFGQNWKLGKKTRVINMRMFNK